MSFGNQLVVSYHFGTSVTLDAYWALYAAANLLLFYVQPLREALVLPVFTTFAQDLERASTLFTAGLALQGLLALVSISLLLLTPAPVLNLFGAHQIESMNLLWGFLPFFVLHATAETCNGLLLSFNRAIYQSVARLLSSVMGLTCLWLLAGHIGVLALLLSLLISQFTILAVSALGLYREGIRLRWQGFVQLWNVPRFRPVFSALLVNCFFAQAYVVCERVTMLGLFPGLVASYQYSVALVNVLISLMAIPLANLLWPKFLAQATHEGVDAMLESSARVVAPMVLVLLGCCTFAERFSVEIVQLLFARGSFDSVSVSQTSQAFGATVFAAIPVSLFTIFSRILFSQGRGRAIAASGISVAVIGSGIVLLAGWLGSVPLVRWHWVVSNSIGLMIILYLLLRRTSDPIKYVRAGWSLTWRAGLAVLVSIWLTPEIGPAHAAVDIILGLSLSFAVFCVSFIGLLYLMGALYLPDKKTGFFN
ncbi:MAG: hypothetical protein HQ450_01660 [Alcaligenaceae bacterium]|nr:hypothetical protein [Alcaligenaceae bacterium]